MSFCKKSLETTKDFSHLYRVYKILKDCVVQKTNQARQLKTKSHMQSEKGANI